MPIDVSALQQRLVTAFDGELIVAGVLGAGGFAAVFRAHDPVLQRDIAIKVIDLATAVDVENRDQFLREARIVATVEHPNIVPLYGVEIRHDLLCLMMRLVPGRSLAERIRQGPLEPRDAIAIANEVSDALATAHAHGVVHRDIKPENILLDSGGHAIVTDFGISLVTGRTSERRPGMVIGTPQYLSPEQALGEDVDGRADVYSLGVVLYEMLAGRPPFESRTTSGLLAKQIIETPPPLASLQPDTPAALLKATDRALMKSPTQRPSAIEFAAELQAARAPDQLLSPKVLRRRKRWRRVRRFAAVTIVLVAIVAAIVWVAIQSATTFAGGSIPAISVFGARNVPGEFVDSALADGSLRPNEAVQYVFVPGKKSWSDALIITDSFLVRRSATGPRRYRITGDSLSYSAFRQGHNRGLVYSEAHRTPDTIYSQLSGAELGAIYSAMNQLVARRKSP